jgi:hypothetical protein
MIYDSPIDLKNQLPEIPFRSLPDILPPWLDEYPEKEYSFRYMLEIYLPWMERESEICVEKSSNFLYALFQICEIGVDEYEVIDISAIISDP